MNLDRDFLQSAAANAAAGSEWPAIGASNARMIGSVHFPIFKYCRNPH